MKGVRREFGVGELCSGLEVFEVVCRCGASEHGAVG